MESVESFEIHSLSRFPEISIFVVVVVVVNLLLVREMERKVRIEEVEKSVMLNTSMVRLVFYPQRYSNRERGGDGKKGVSRKLRVSKSSQGYYDWDMISILSHHPSHLYHSLFKLLFFFLSLVLQSRVH